MRLSPIWKRALSIALPLMLAESIDSLLWLADTYFVSGLGDKAIEAVGLGGYLSWFLFSGGSMIYMGALVVIAQAFGASRRDLAFRALGEAITSNVLVSIPVGVGSLLAAGGLVGLLSGPNVSAEARELALVYFKIRLAGLPFLYAGLSLDAAYRGSGVTRPVLYATATSALSNAALDPVLIYGLLGAPRLGVLGAALASVAASVVYLAVLAALASRSLGLRLRLLLPGSLAARMMRLGLPALVERLAFVGGNLAYLGSVARCGDATLAAHTIGVRIESLAFLPLFSIGESAAALVGQEVGAGRVAEAERAGIEVSKLNIVVGLIVAALLASVSSVLPAVFTEDKVVRRLAGIYLVIAAASEPPFAAAAALSMSIRGAGNTVVPTAINLVSLYVIRVLPALILPAHMPEGLCAIGAWIPMLTDQIGRATLSLVTYKRLFHRLARRIL